MRSFENGSTIYVIDIGPRCNTDTTYHGRQGIRDIITIEIERGDDIVFGRTQQNLLEEGISDDILDQQRTTIEGFLLRRVSSFLTISRSNTVVLCPRPYLAAVFAFSQGITPFLKLTFGIFHDVALVHQGNAFASLAHGIVDGSADEPFGAFDGNRLDADRGGFRETNILDAQLFNQESFDACIFRRTGEVFNSGVDIFGVFAEN